MKVRKILVLLSLILPSVAGGILAIPQFGSAAENSDDPLEPATHLIVMIEGEIDGTPTFGAGIIFSLDEEQVYIATANHVVRRGSQEAKNLRVRFKKYPDTFFPAELLEHFDPELGLAVLRMSELGKEGIDLSDLDMSVLGKGSSMNRGDGVYAVGNPNGVPWGMPVVPDQIAQIVGKGITFQSAFIISGHSGGGLVEESGVLIGMIVKDHPPFGLATKIDEIASTLTNWGYSFGLKQISTYEIDGKWKTDNSMIGLIEFNVEGDKLSGWASVIRETSYGSPEPTTYYSNGNILSGQIKGNKISFQVKGSWETTTWRWGQEYTSRGKVAYLVHFNGRLTENNLLLSYEFEYPPLGHDSRGKITAKRVK